MNRILSCSTALLAVLGAVIPAVAQVETTQIMVRLFNRSSVTVAIVNEGESQAGEILRRAGIDVSWMNCDEAAPECVEEPSATNLIFTIVKQGSGMGSKEVLGIAVQDSAGSGAYGYIFENKLNEVSGQNHIPAARLLGYAMAHELGHLLKGSHSHSPTGIMSCLWSKYELAELSRGALWFTSKDAEVMHSRLRKIGDIKQTAKLDTRR